jgi:hypothetical protein
MGQYRKRPVVIEAIQFTGMVSGHYLTRELALFLAEVVTSEKAGGIIIHTLEGEMRADPGDWIIKGVKGEFYPCKPDIFAATYEPV